MDVNARFEDVGARKMDQVPALYWAIEAGDEKAVEFLIGNGADVDATDGNGDTPLERAARIGKREMAECLLSHGADVYHGSGKIGGTALHVGAVGGHVDLVKLLINQGAPVNAGDHEGLTALSRATEYLERGRGRSGIMDVRRQRNCREIVEFLKQHGGKKTNRGF